jgi:hypothetical protein
MAPRRIIKAHDINVSRPLREVIIEDVTQPHVNSPLHPLEDSLTPDELAHDVRPLAPPPPHPPASLPPINTRRLRRRRPSSLDTPSSLPDVFGDYCRAHNVYRAENDATNALQTSAPSDFNATVADALLKLLAAQANPKQAVKMLASSGPVTPATRGFVRAAPDFPALMNLQHEYGRHIRLVFGGASSPRLFCEAFAARWQPVNSTSSSPRLATIPSAGATISTPARLAARAAGRAARRPRTPHFRRAMRWPETSRNRHSACAPAVRARPAPRNLQATQPLSREGLDRRVSATA